jgi:hypothetical protein
MGFTFPLEGFGEVEKSLFHDGNRSLDTPADNPISVGK